MRPLSYMRSVVARNVIYLSGVYRTFLLWKGTALPVMPPVIFKLPFTGNLGLLGYEALSLGKWFPKF